MALRRPTRHSEAAAGVALGLGLVIGLAGCVGHGARRAETPAVQRREASRDELLAKLEQAMSRLATLSASARMSLYDQDVVVPATVAGDVARMSGEPYRKKFLQVEVNGELLLSRTTEGHRNIRFSGEVIGPNLNFLLLGKDNTFWMLLPATKEERDRLIAQGQAAPAGRVLTGTLDPKAVRPKSALAMRPQDIADLLLVDEVFRAHNGSDICYIETWPDYYVMNFLRRDWPEHIYSKIFVERQGLTVAIHQLFDGAGEVVAEGRFADYVRRSAKGSNVSVEIPSEIQILWPRDKVVLRAKLWSLKVNEAIQPKFFDEKILDRYPHETLELPAAPAR